MSNLKIKTYGDCTGPFGFPMDSVCAKSVEDLFKALPKDCQDLGLMRVAKVSSVQDFAEDERADISFITTDSVDRDGEVMYAKGGDFTQFRKNPVVTFAHKYDELPVGRCMWLTQDEKSGRKGWKAKTQYTPQPKNWPASLPFFPELVWHYVRERCLPGKSIGFLALEVRSPEPKEIEQRPELSKVRRVIPKWLALEYAIAPVPCNPDALVSSTAKARKKGLTVSETLLDAFGMIIPEGVPPSEEQPKPERRVLSASELEAYVKKGIAGALQGLDMQQIIRDQFDLLRGRV